MGKKTWPHSLTRLGADAHRLVETQHRPGRVPELRGAGPAPARPGHRRGEVPRRRARLARLRPGVDRHGRRPGVSPAPARPLPLLHARRGPLRPAMPHQPGPAAADRRGGGGGAVEDPQRQRQPAARACPDGERQMSQYKIWFQGATDRVQHAPYINKVEPHLKAILDPEFSGTFNTTTPPATTTHAVTELRIARNFIRNAIEAERQGYDAIAITHFQDAGLAEPKSVLDIPLLGLGETTLFHACTLGRKLGLVTINPVFIPWHEDQVIRYGLQQRVVGVRAVQATIADFIDSFASEDAKRKLAPKWERECRILLDAGADVIVPAGGGPTAAFRARAGRDDARGPPV